MTNTYVVDTLDRLISDKEYAETQITELANELIERILEEGKLGKLLDLNFRFEDRYQIRNVNQDDDGTIWFNVDDLDLGTEGEQYPISQFELQSQIDFIKETVNL